MSVDMLPWPVTLFFMVWTLGCALILKRSIRISRDVDSWLTNDKRGKNMVEQEGYDRAYRLVKNIGVPLGIVVPLFFLVAGVAMWVVMADASSTAHMSP
ncbi:hypothetical protein [Oceanobacter kriegii]|uniref:hypothetical protein n=1 Tax=Oceanobacter kriegii TaxID=64972 RepID=UPI00042075D1|nr:hypothetical protein [Oceanobacter kriegii]